MKKIIATLYTTVFIFVVNPGSAQPPALLSGKAAGWVTVNSIDYTNTAMESEADDGYLDLGFEKQVSLADEAKYFRKTFKVLSEAGVENNSEVSIVYDPSFQRVVIHTVKIIRSGVSFNKLNLSKFKTIQQESDLRAHVYNGSLTAFMLLDDVRKGDIIEYSYTIKGFNPIFKGKYCDVFETRFGVPIANVYYKIVSPPGRMVNIKSSDVAIEAKKSQLDNGTVFEWNLRQIKALRVDKRTPSWYDPFPAIFASEYNSWGEVSNWASELFPVTVHLSKSLLKKIGDIRAQQATDEERTLTALHFVQDEVRYMGIEMGERSHKPGDPNKIYSQRFGDCKDKSYLLITMLRALGMEARPVLINTSYKQTINSWLPSHSAFDHVTVRVKVKGKFYFLDPTISLQRGQLPDISFPNYQTGLVVSDSTRSLTTISSQDKGMVKINEIIDVPDMSGKARLRVISKYSGSYADVYRNDFNSNSLYEIKKKYRDFYAAYFDEIVADSVDYATNDETGEFTTTEYYTISGLWKVENGRSVTTTAFAPFVISSVLAKPDNQSRTMPFSLVYPVNYIEDIEINLPEDWSVDMKQKMVQCGFFNLNSNASFDNRKIKLHYEYENLKDHVPAEELSIYGSNFKVAEEICRGWNLTLNSNNSYRTTGRRETSTASTGNIFTQLYIILGFFVIMTAIIKRRNRQEQA